MPVGSCALTDEAEEVHDSALPDDEARALQDKSDESFQPLALQDAEAEEIHGRFMDLHTNICNMLTPEGAVCATYSGIVDVFVETIHQYIKSLHDRLIVEQDLQLCIVLAQRAEESAQWRSVVLPHTDRRKRPDKRKKRPG